MTVIDEQPTEAVTNDVPAEPTDGLSPIERHLRRRRHRQLFVALVVSAMTVAGVVLLFVPDAGAAGGCGGG